MLRPMAPRTVLWLSTTVWLALAASCSDAPPERERVGRAEARRIVEAERTAARDARLAAMAAELDAHLAAMETYLDEELFLTTLERGIETARATEDPNWLRIDDGWMFTRSMEGYVDLNRPRAGRELPFAIDFQADEHPIRTIIDFQRQLAENDIDFLVVPVPERLHTHPELLLGIPAIEGFVGWDPGMARFLRKLVEVGVEVLELTPRFAAQRTLETKGDNSTDVSLDVNRHWSPLAAELAARALAGHVRQLEWAEAGGPYREGEHFEVRPGATIEWLPREQIAPGTPSPVPLTATVVEPLAGWEPMQRGPEAPILILGDSYAHMYSENDASVVHHLARFTGFTVDPIWPARGGASLARKALYRRRDNLEGKRLVIWMFGVEALTFEGEWEMYDFFGN